MLTQRQQELYNAFYESTHKNEYLDRKTEILVGLAAAMAMNCAPCVHYYLQLAEEGHVGKGEISEVLAKVMAVAAGQKRLQMKQVIEDFGVDMESFG